MFFNQAIFEVVLQLITAKESKLLLLPGRAGGRLGLAYGKAGR